MAQSLFVVPHDQYKSVNVHPVVLFSILDHHSRREEDQDRVIGTLLGYEENGVVFIRNSFPVPHSEGEDVAVKRDYHRNMFELHQKANFREEIVGWLASLFLVKFLLFNTCLQGIQAAQKSTSTQSFSTIFMEKKQTNLQYIYVLEQISNQVEWIFWLMSVSP
jgi:hypothetical protein